jgi:hypothetical protein
MEEADDLLQPDDVAEDVADAALMSKSSHQVSKAVKKNDWALRSVLKGMGNHSSSAGSLDHK